MMVKAKQIKMKEPVIPTLFPKHFTPPFPLFYPED